jgi:hypothetical protein
VDCPACQTSLTVIGFVPSRPPTTKTPPSDNTTARCSARAANKGGALDQAFAAGSQTMTLFVARDPWASAQPPLTITLPVGSAETAENLGTLTRSVVRQPA